MAPGKPSGTSEGSPRATGNVLPQLLACAVVSLWLGGGCAEQNGVLEVDSGPPISRSTGSGAKIPTYAVHVGECPTIRFRSKVGTCDYAVMHDESNGRYEDCGPCLGEQFEWKYAVGEAGPAESPIRITVAGYLQQRSRDRMPLGGEMVDGQREGDEPDLKLAQASVLVQVYQSVVEIAVKMPQGRPDWSLTRLTVTREDGQQTRMRQKATGERGFTVSGPDEAGIWHVRYEPKAAEVNRSGETAAELQVADEQGQLTSFRQRFATP
jgi:hypothetical protein